MHDTDFEDIQEQSVGGEIGASDIEEGLFEGATPIGFSVSSNEEYLILDFIDDDSGVSLSIKEVDGIQLLDSATITDVHSKESSTFNFPEDLVRDVGDLISKFTPTEIVQYLIELADTDPSVTEVGLMQDEAKTVFKNSELAQKEYEIEWKAFEGTHTQKFITGVDKPIIDTLRNFIEERGEVKVFDLHFGTGRVMDSLNAAFPALVDFEGYDFNPFFRDKAANNPALEVKVSDSYGDIPQSLKDVDVFIATSAIHLLDDGELTQLLSDLKDNLPEDAKIIFSIQEPKAMARENIGRDNAVDSDNIASNQESETEGKDTSWGIAKETSYLRPVEWYHDFFEKAGFSSESKVASVGDIYENGELLTKADAYVHFELNKKS